MLNNRWSWPLMIILGICLMIPLGCAKREREPEKVSKEQINDFNQAMVELKEAGVALDFKDLSNYTDEEKVLLNPERLTDLEKVDKAVDKAVVLLLKVLKIKSTTEGLSLPNIMSIDTVSGLTDEDAAYCYLELARLYILRAATIAARAKNRFEVKFKDDGSYEFEPGEITKYNLSLQEIQDFIDIVYILCGIKLKHGDTYGPSKDICEAYFPYEHSIGLKGAVGLALQFVDLAGKVLSKDIENALKEVKDKIEAFKNGVREKEGEWEFVGI